MNYYKLGLILLILLLLLFIPGYVVYEKYPYWKQKYYNEPWNSKNLNFSCETDIDCSIKRTACQTLACVNVNSPSALCEEKTINWNTHLATDYGNAKYCKCENNKCFSIAIRDYVKDEDFCVINKDCMFYGSDCKIVNKFHYHGSEESCTLNKSKLICENYKCKLQS